MNTPDLCKCGRYVTHECHTWATDNGLSGPHRPQPVSTQFIIQDWTGKRLFPGKTFDSFEDGWSFLYERFPTDDDSNGFYDDFYVVGES